MLHMWDAVCFSVLAAEDTGTRGAVGTKGHAVLLGFSLPELGGEWAAALLLKQGLSYTGDVLGSLSTLNTGTAPLLH
jgi:hypothetical protein